MKLTCLIRESQVEPPPRPIRAIRHGSGKPASARCSQISLEVDFLVEPLLKNVTLDVPFPLLGNPTNVTGLLSRAFPPEIRISALLGAFRKTLEVTCPNELR